MKVALVHDWLVTYRGGERVLEALCRMYPDAPIFTLFHQQGSQPKAVEQHPIIESGLAKIPFARSRHRMFLPLFPFAIERFDLQAYDLVISTSHAVAKGVITRADAMHISYVHTPMRYVWEREADYLAGRSALVQAAFAVCAPLLRLWDESSERRVDHFVANSRTVAWRIWKRYRRESHVIHPPVDTDRFSPQDEAPSAQAPYLVVSALVPYKRIDLVIEAFRHTPQRRLEIVGDGPERAKLMRHAPANVRFLGYQDNTELAAIYRRSRALLFPGEEDFGITPLECMAAGRPVVAYGRGGATETVIPCNQPAGVGRAPTGVWFMEQTAAALAAAIDTFETHEERFAPRAIAAWAAGFHRDRFTEKMREYIALVARAHQGGPKEELLRPAGISRLQRKF